MAQDDCADEVVLAELALAELEEVRCRIPLGGARLPKADYERALTSARSKTPRAKQPARLSREESVQQRAHIQRWGVDDV